jgi:hypothetical protein
MKISKFKLTGSVLFTLAAIALTANAQTGSTNYGIITFDTTNTVTGPGSPPWQNWFGGAFTSVAWSTNDQPVNTLTTNTSPGTSGSVQINSLWNGSGDQIMVMNNYGGYNPPLNGAYITNFECDVMFAPGSCTNPAGNFGGLHFGARSPTYGQTMFGTTRIAATNAGTWVHINFPVSSTTQPDWASIPNVLVQLESFGNPMTGTSTFYVDNIKFGGVITLPPPPPPTMSVDKATPGLRIFAKNSAQVYNAEGFLTPDSNQSWVGHADPAFQVSYSFTFKDFNTVNGFQFFMALVPNNYNSGGVNNPFTLFNSTNSFQLTITKQAAGFGASLDFKTNAPQGGLSHNVMSTNATQNGTWTLSFSDDTHGAVITPDGHSAPFTLDPNMAAQWANPVSVFFGIQPWSSQGYGQYVDISRITTANVSGLNINDDFTTDTSLIAAYWDTSLSLDAGSVVLVPPGTPFWVHWTYPDAIFTGITNLETKVNLTDTNTPWYSPQYWNGVTPFSGLMGAKQRWVLIPTNCLPTVDGTQGGVPSKTGFFRLANPGASQ